MWPWLRSNTPPRSDFVGRIVAHRSCKGVGECRGVHVMPVSSDCHPFCHLGGQLEPLQYVRGDGGLGLSGVGKGGGDWVESGYVLKVDPIRFADVMADSLIFPLPTILYSILTVISLSPIHVFISFFHRPWKIHVQYLFIEW